MKKPPKFITTIELGRLARWLRILGYDCVFFDRGEKKDIVIESLREYRIILTRDSKLSRFSGIRMVHVDSDAVEEQFTQVMNSLHLKVDKNNVFTRCAKCNTMLDKTNKENHKWKIPPHVYKTQDDFKYCISCDKVYWKGSHWRLAKKFMEKLKI